MKFYHYTSSERYHAILSGNHYGKKGLIPLARFVSLSLYAKVGLPQKASEGSTSGLLRPFDNAWCKREFPEGKALLEYVVHNIPSGPDPQIYLLEAKVLPSDDVYVADFSPNIRPKCSEREKDYFDDIRSKKQDYWNSLMPFSEYKKRGISYLVPEVISFSPIPVERLRVVEIFNQHDLINKIRKEGGFLPLPPIPVRNRKTIIDFLEPDPPTPDKKTGSRQHLRLV